MNQNYTEKMKGIQAGLVESISDYYGKEGAVECHVFGSIAEDRNDVLSDVDIWITFKDNKIQEVLENRMNVYAKFGEIILLHEMQNNFPLDGVQTAILYKINSEIVRVDYYLCPKSSSRILPNSKIIFDQVGIQEGDIIPETKSAPRDFSDSVTFLISMCFNTIKNIIRNKPEGIDFLLNEFKKKYEDKLDKDYKIASNNDFETIYLVLDALVDNSNGVQIKAIEEIRVFMERVRGLVI